MTPSLRKLTITLLAGAAACTAGAPTDASPSASSLQRSASIAWSGWSPALSIEDAPPGAHPNFNTEFAEGCPFISPDGRTFFIASNRPGGKGGLDIWISTRASADDPWGDPVNAGEPINSAADDFCPTMARDNHTFYFVSKRQVGVQGVDWCGGGDIYVSRRRGEEGEFDEPRNLGCDVNSAAEEFSPFPIEERGAGPVLYFSSTRPRAGAMGGDLYRSESHGGTFGAPELVPGVNSAMDDGQPNLRHDGLELYFYSNRPDADAQGGNDIYVATRASASDPWSVPVNLGRFVNSPASETRPSLSWDGSTLYVGSNRTGSEARNGIPSGDIYVTTRTRAAGR
jgi:Tol biopolymer transport system component